MSEKIIIYVDMDGVIVDFESGIAKLDPLSKEKYKEHYDHVPGIFSIMDPIDNAIDSVKYLFGQKNFDVYFLSKPSHKNSSSYSDKRDWIVKHFGSEFYAQRLILTQHKHLNIGDYLIDDRPVPKFTGKQLLFGSEEFPTWSEVIDFFKTFF